MGKPEDDQFEAPPCTDKPKTVRRMNGDLWLGVNIGRMSRRTALAWSALQIESTYDSMEAAIEAQQRAIPRPS